MHADRNSLQAFLLDKGILEEAELKKALQLQTQERISLVRALQRSSPQNKDRLMDGLSEYFGIPRMQADQFLIDPIVVSEIPEDLARRFTLIPLFKVENELTLATADPRDIQAVDEIRRITGYKINLVLTEEISIKRAIEIQYPEVARLEAELREIDEGFHADSALDSVETENLAELQSAAEQQGTVRIVNLILTRAIREGASDIHIEPAEKKLRVRFRTDGVLKEVMEPPRDLQLAIVSRLKIMANLDIAEKRAPQDGRFQISSSGRQTDVRLSTLPTIYGEKVVMRLLNAGQVDTKMETLGFAGEQQKLLDDWIHQPYGMILVTGPTGSGKTTTLYAAMNRINNLERNIVTVEDPVEYRLDIINQVQVDPRANLTFASGLRSILRQDPDVIMVGEIRDRETAQMAIESALTGHLVLSTLHTNDAPSAPARLIDMGVEPFLLSSALLGVLAQRLVRKICNECKESYELPSDAVAHDPLLSCLSGKQVWRGNGCPACEYTGYRGRIGVFELLAVHPEIKEAIVKRSSTEQMTTIAMKNGYRVMRQEGIEQVLQGMTTLEELFRVTVSAG